MKVNPANRPPVSPGSSKSVEKSPQDAKTEKVYYTLGPGKFVGIEHKGKNGAVIAYKFIVATQEDADHISKDVRLKVFLTGDELENALKKFKLDTNPRLKDLPKLMFGIEIKSPGCRFEMK